MLHWLVVSRSGSYENILGTNSSTPSPTSPDTQPPSPSRYCLSLTHPHTHTHTHTHTHKHTHDHTHTHTHTHTHKHRNTDRQTDRQTDIQTDRQVTAADSSTWKHK